MKKAYFEKTCDSCNQRWSIEVDANWVKTIKAAAKLTGYTCNDCAGTESTMFPATKIE